ncbi:MAG: DinB family protein, partial [Candidatus Kapaibacterium sp.]
MKKHLIIAHPKSGEYPEYLSQYITLVPSNDLLNYFDTQKESIASVAAQCTEEQLVYRYVKGKWSIKDICCHVIDTERIYNYRALCIARGDK